MASSLDKPNAGKRKRDDDTILATRKMSSWGLKLQIKWFACHIARTQTSSIVKSLRAAYPDWTIVAEPHWFRELGGPFI